MLTRSSGYLPSAGPAPAAVESLQSDGYVVLHGVFVGEELAALRSDVERVFADYPPDERGDPPEEAAPFRYEMLNRSSLVQQAIGNPRILETIEPLLGEDCHVIANTAWRQEYRATTDISDASGTSTADPTSRRDPSVPWDPRIPYPVFAIAAHLYLWDCPIEAGPTGVIREATRLDKPSHGEARRRRPAVGRPWRRADRRRSQVTSPSSSDIWHRRLPRESGIPDECSSSATTDVAISPNASDRIGGEPASPTDALLAPEQGGRGRSSDSIPWGSTTADGPDCRHPCRISMGRWALGSASVVGLAGIEPATSALSVLRSNRLSYSPFLVRATFCSDHSYLPYSCPNGLLCKAWRRGLHDTSAPGRCGNGAPVIGSCVRSPVAIR